MGLVDAIACCQVDAISELSVEVSAAGMELTGQGYGLVLRFRQLVRDDQDVKASFDKQRKVLLLHFQIQ